MNGDMFVSMGEIKVDSSHFSNLISQLNILYNGT